MQQDPSPADIGKARDQFLELVAGLRPELHRYCARLTGSIIEGEDLVQDTLAKAFYALGMASELPPLRPWLFRIAHNTTLDALRRYERRHVRPVAELPEAIEAPETVDAGDVQVALSAFLHLPVAQRSVVILKDVLGCSLEEIVEITGSTLQAVKSALARGRANLRLHAAGIDPELPAAADPRGREMLHRYAALFNARDWDGLRSLVAEDCRLELVSKATRRGAEVRGYFGRYAALPPLRVRPGLLEGRPALAVYEPDDLEHPLYYILLELDGDRVAAIRDYRYVPYIARELFFDPTDSFEPPEPL